VAACWAHTRREFHQAKYYDPGMIEVLGQIARLYAIRRTHSARRGQHGRASRNPAAESLPILDALNDLLTQRQGRRKYLPRKGSQPAPPDTKHQRFQSLGQSLFCLVKHKLDGLLTDACNRLIRPEPRVGLLRNSGCIYVSPVLSLCKFLWQVVIGGFSSLDVPIRKKPVHPTIVGNNGPF